MHPRRKLQKRNMLFEGSFKEALAISGYSENVTDKVWKWYNPPKKAEKASKSKPAS